MQPYSVQDLPSSRPLAVGNVFVGRVYRWMAVGLGITCAVGLVVAKTPELQALVFANPMIPIVLMLAQLGMVFAVTSAVRRASATMALGLFLAYSALSGLTFSVIFLVYTQASIAQAFLVAGGMFGGMSVWGWTTKRDLTTMGSYLGMAVWGLILAVIAHMFIASGPLDFVISLAGVAIFTGLTAWDTQKIKRIGEQVDAESEVGRSLAVNGALMLYLDFINLFLFLLRLMGRRR